MIMKVYIIGIDGLEFDILEQYEKYLPNFRKIKQQGFLGRINSVFPVDSVPAWQTIFTGLNPAQHGIVRGKDYVESVKDFEKLNNFNLIGNTFWDKLSSQNKKCLILNPFLAYPSWTINGLMISGPAFVEGLISKYPENVPCNPDAYGGYKPMRIGKLKDDLLSALDDIKKLWKEFVIHSQNDSYDLSFVTFTQLDRIQHYTWRYYDIGDPLHEKDSVLSELIKETLVLLDSYIGEIINKVKDGDHIIIISDHGFGQRPYKLININELLRQNGLLKLKDNMSSENVRFRQKIRNFSIKVLSKLKILDVISVFVKKIPYFNKYKKSEFLIDKEKSLCYVAEYFSGKNAYCGFNFGKILKESSKEARKEVIDKLACVLNTNKEIPKYKWMKTANEVYQGEYVSRFPDICMELATGYGVEFDMFDKIITESVTHYKISGGHRNPGTFGYYSPDGKKCQIDSIEEFHNFILSLFY